MPGIADFLINYVAKRPESRFTDRLECNIAGGISRSQAYTDGYQGRASLHG